MIDFLRKNKGELLTASDWNRLLDLVRQALSLHVAAPLVMHNTPQGKQIAFAGVPGAINWIRIESATQDGSNFRWEYTVTLMTPPLEAFGEWGEREEATAYNTIEHENDDDDSGVQSGIDLSVVGVAGIEPVHVGAIVPAWSHVFPGDSETEPARVWFFTYPNAPVIDCDEPEEA